jgi:hypothetical protein
MCALSPSGRRPWSKVVGKIHEEIEFLMPDGCSRAALVPRSHVLMCDRSCVESGCPVLAWEESHAETSSPAYSWSYIPRVGEFARRFEVASGYTIDDLASRFRSRDQTHGRIVFSTLAASRYGIRACDIATLIGKHGHLVTKWLTEGLRKEGVNPGFKNQLDNLDALISCRR